MIINLDDKRIEIWQTTYSKSVFVRYNNYYDILNNEEKKNAFNFKLHHYREFYIFSRIVLKLLLSKYTGISPELIQIFTNNYGKPFIKSTTPIKFNISHSKDKLVIAIAPFEVGIDIEYINQNFNIHEIINLVLSEKEKLNIKKLSPDTQNKLFYSYWTKKEAVVKAIGVGLNMDLSKLEIYNDRIYNKGKEWFITSLNCFDENYVGHFVCNYKNTIVVRYFLD